jgi:8-oxo-dGTP pyrophosphatase MutT (NUDIX family)
MPASDYMRALRDRVGTMRVLSPGVAVVIYNDSGEVLLQQRSDDGKWGLPGGALELGEEPADAAVREVWEETGLQVVPVRLVGIYGGQDGFHTYPSGDEMAFIAMLFVCQVVGGQIGDHNDGESLDLRYFSPDQLPDALFSRHQLFIQDARNNQVSAHFRYSGELQK